MATAQPSCSLPTRLSLRARVGLGEALTPELVGGQDLLQMPGLLGRRAVFHQRRAEHRQPAAVHELGRLGARHLLEQDDLLGERRAAAAELPGPVHADITGLPHRLLPAAQPPHLVDVGARRREGLAAQLVRHVGLEPRPDLLPKHLLPLAELEIHSLPHLPVIRVPGAVARATRMVQMRGADEGRAEAYAAYAAGAR